MPPADHRQVGWIDGVGVVSALGDDMEALAAAVRGGRGGAAPVQRFSVEGFRARSAATVARFDERCDGTEHTNRDFTLELARMAAKQLGLQGRSSRRALVLGTSLGDHPKGVHRIAEILADEIGADGPRLTVSTACASSTNAIGLGLDLLRFDECDEAIVGGADRLSVEVFAGFDALGLLTTSRCTPFGPCFGTMLGEGAGFLRLVRTRPIGRPRAFAILGYGLSCDAYHATTPDPSGAGVARAMNAALNDAGCDGAAVDYVQTHGTGTAANDPAEWRAIERVLGARAANVPVSGSKGQLGHAQGAAGVLELLVMLACMAEGTLPPTFGTETARPRSPSGLLLGNVPVTAKAHLALKNSAAFAGANASLVIGDDDAVDANAARRLAEPATHADDIFLLGAGVVGPFGVGLSALSASPEATGRCPPIDLGALVPDLDARGLDPASRMLTAAAALALAHGGLHISGAMRDRVGLFLATLRVSPSAGRAFRQSIETRGLARLSAPAFTHMVLNAPAGVCSKALSLRGPTTTLTTGDGSGVSALLYAARHLAARSDVDAMLVGAVAELDEGEAGIEGATVWLLGKKPTAQAYQLVGSHFGGPLHADSTLARARAAVDRGADSVVLTRRESECAANGLLPRATVSLFGDGRASHARSAHVLLERSSSVTAAIALLPVEVPHG